MNLHTVMLHKVMAVGELRFHIFYNYGRISLKALLTCKIGKRFINLIQTTYQILELDYLIKYTRFWNDVNFFPWIVLNDDFMQRYPVLTCFC